MLGLDAFAHTAKDVGLDSTAAAARRRRARRDEFRNPWSRGCVVNCKDFWCGDVSGGIGGEDGVGEGVSGRGVGVLGGERVDYFKLYEVPRRRGDGAV